MSFDLGVFYTKTPLTDEEATKRYIAYCGEEDFSKYVEPSPAITKFVEELTSKYPQIDDVAEDKLDDCPWSIAFDISEGHVLIAMRFSMAKEASDLIIELAYKHGLVCFDPQSSKIVVAPEGINKSNKQKPWWKFW